MLVSKEIKNKICAHLQQLLDDKRNVIFQAIESAKESRNSDTKSSAGDKFETGRAMMQIEIDKNEAQLSKVMRLQKELSEINTFKVFNKVEYGSLVLTNEGIYFVAIGIGKIEIDNIYYYSVSLVSPIGQMLKGMVVGEETTFQGRVLIVEGII